MLARLVSTVTGLFLLLGLVGTGVLPQSASAQTVLSAEEREMVEMVNDYRARHGRSALQVHTAYRDVSREHSGRMASRNSLHHNPNLASDADRAIPGWRLIGENVGTGSSVSSIQKGFVNSREHRENMLSPDFRILAVGVVRASNGRLYVTQNFADRTSSPSPASTEQSSSEPAPKSSPKAVGMTPTPSGAGYWLTASNGGVFAYGDAPFHGSAGNIRLQKPVVDMAKTGSGDGYWLTATDGGIFAYGRAAFHGSAGNINLRKPIVGMSPTSRGDGYWLVASDGGIFAYGRAAFHGSAGNIRLNQPIVGMAATPTGNGYWLVARDGGIFAYGDASFHGSAGNIRLNQPIVGMAATPTGNGYWLLGADGGVFAYGDAPFHGSSAR